MYIVGVQDAEDDAHDEAEYGADEPLREQVHTFLDRNQHILKPDP